MNEFQKNYQNQVKGAERLKHESAFLALVRYNGIEEPKPQYRFHEARLWRVDFAWPEWKVAVEIEGGIWRRDRKGNWAGAHSHPSNIERDIEKSNALALAGYSLLRFTEKEIKSGVAVFLVRDLIANKKALFSVLEKA